LRQLCAGLLAACLVSSQAAADGLAPPAGARLANFEHERASSDARYVADWVANSGDNAGLPFVILDKKDARIFVFYADGHLRAAAPALLGLGRGDTALPGIGDRKLSDIPPRDRVTPAGRFVSQMGTDSHGEDVLWVDYEGAVAIHRVITANPRERRLQRLATPTPRDNRISWGCINVPAKFYEQVVQATFAGTKGIVYVLPETSPPGKFFAAYDAAKRAPTQVAGRSEKFEVQQ
jgi:hypothetical protein